MQDREHLPRSCDDSSRRGDSQAGWNFRKGQPKGDNRDAHRAPEAVTVPLCSRTNAGPFWIMLLLVRFASRRNRSTDLPRLLRAAEVVITRRSVAPRKRPPTGAAPVGISTLSSDCLLGHFLAQGFYFSHHIAAHSSGRDESNQHVQSYSR